MSGKSNYPVTQKEIIAGMGGKRTMNTKENKQYEKPSITTYSEDELMDLLGPANTAGSPFFGDMHGSVHGSTHGHGGGHGRH
ncbi:MAG: hypothetical protein NTV89_05870 [Proteobacteria bacterium]|nr:hypothetical protein [Pseudomonadota bacterium]